MRARDGVRDAAKPGAKMTLVVESSAALLPEQKRSIRPRTVFL
jgi:hypothetical protein